jgi:hypothetical protein
MAKIEMLKVSIRTSFFIDVYINVSYRSRPPPHPNPVPSLVLLPSKITYFRKIPFPRRISRVRSRPIVSLSYPYVTGNTTDKSLKNKKISFSLKWHYGLSFFLSFFLFGLSCWVELLIYFKRFTIVERRLTNKW